MNTATNFADHYLADISKNQDEIENAMRDFPASSVVRFLWLYQLKLNNDSRFEDAARQVGIYLQNPYWIQFQLSDSAIANENDLETPSIISSEISKTEVKDETQSQSIDSETQNPVSENESLISDENNVEEIIEQKIDEELPQAVNEEIIENSVLENEEDNDETIPFEPLHTVDYFASQGIKLSEEALQNDQLGKQVKSFTAWLKSMKKLHPGQLPEQNEVIERLIQTSSEASNQNANVLTEAMAEVLVKQDKREKAIEMYQKLSLLNPSKSAYFAAKIESLKSI